MKNKILAALILCICQVGQAQEIADLKPAMMKVAYFQASDNDYRYQKLETAIESHEAHKPQDWDSLVDIVKIQSDDYSKVAMANLIANQIPYVDGTDGTYFSPLKGMKRGGVVCKDYAVFKYLLLKEAGYPTEKMALLIHQSVNDPTNGAHVVLIVEIESELWIANQFWKSTAGEFYKDYKINPSKLSQEIRKHGVTALKTDWDVKDNKYNKRSLTKVKDYQYTDRLVLSVVNEFGVMSDKKYKLIEELTKKATKKNKKKAPQPPKSYKYSQVALQMENIQYISSI